jgi:dihydroorotate dehydrogenase electron transfer subunit
MKQCNLKVAHIRHLKGGYVDLTLTYDESLEVPEPGQFFMLKPHNTLLARPISVHNFFYVLKRGYVEFLFKVVGEGTYELSRKVRGDYVTVWGPIGNHFPVFEARKTAILVAGGRGIAPLFYLATTLFDKGYDIYLFYGVKESDELVHLLRLKNLCKRLFITTEDGKRGKKGIITNLFSDSINQYFDIREQTSLFDEKRARLPVCYVCGPDIMIERVCEISLKHDIETYISLEARMACGTGVCLGCAVESRGGRIYHICKEGPVFNAKEFYCL